MEAQVQVRNEDYESLYESVNLDDQNPVDETVFGLCIQRLLQGGFLVQNVNYTTDEVWYRGKSGMKFRDFSHLDNPLDKQVLLQFVENPETFFVLFNTQKGKSNMIYKEVMAWTREAKKVIIPFIMLDNDTTLGDQFCESLQARFNTEQVPIKLFSLSSTAKTKMDIEHILTYIDSYVAFPNEKPTPVITALTNQKQLEKVIEILEHITVRKRQRFDTLYYGMIWDEADKTYTAVRDKEVRIKGGYTRCIRDFTLTNTTGLHRNGFVTATDGDLIDDYPECANAYAYPVEINEEDAKHYRAIHHAEAVLRIIPCGGKQKNNDVFWRTFVEHRADFITRLPDGTFRRTIINSNSKGQDMKALAGKLNAEKCHVLTFNQTGLTVYPYGSGLCRFKTKGRSFGKLLFYVYTLFNLKTAPLFLVGRRKVDRGLGFHFAPRSHLGLKPETLDFDNGGPVYNDGRAGLIWSDEFLGHIEVVQTAVQKAGRLAGIIAQCPEYTGQLTWWLSQETAAVVKHHYERVDTANALQGCNTMLQALTLADERLPMLAVKPAAELDPTKFKWSGQGTADLFELFPTMDAINARKKELNPAARKERSRKCPTTGFYTCTTAFTGRQTIENIRDLKKISSNLPVACEKLQLNEVTMRGYVFYAADETDPEKCHYALRWVKRIG